jgi:mannose-1-phosphate guanylyltransferase
VRFIGTRSMREHTLDRLAGLIPSERVFTVAAQDHLGHSEARRQLRTQNAGTIVLQPVNRETGPGLLLPLMHLVKQYPNSTVAVFPSDHFVLQEELFASYVLQAFVEVEKNPAKIVFMGVKPTDPETEYGYLLPENQDPDCESPVRSIKSFIEKPDLHIALQILSLGAVWNTMVMVFKPEVLLHLIGLAAPELYRSFQRIFQALGTSRESRTIHRVYENMEPMNISKDLLEGVDMYSRNQLSVIDMKGVLWSDWGSETRILSVLSELECRDDFRSELLPAGVRSGAPSIADLLLKSNKVLKELQFSGVV